MEGSLWLEKEIISLLKEMKYLMKRPIIAILFLMLIVGCKSTTYLSSGDSRYVTTVNSFGNYSLIGKTYYIESGDDNIKTNDPEFQEYANYISLNLDGAGATRTTNRSSADLCILMNYGITDQSYNEDVPVPIWGQTGVSSITTNSRTNSSSNSYLNGAGTYSNGALFGSVSGSTYGSRNTTTTTRVEPTYGITGVVSVNRHVDSYRRFINIYAYDNKADSHDLLWKTNLISDGSSSDFRNVASYIIYSSREGTAKSYSDDVAVMKNDYMFNCWKQGFFLNENVTVYPKASYDNVDYCEVALVERLQNETIVVLDFHRENYYFFLSPYLCIDAEGKHYNVIQADNYKMGDKIVNYNRGYIRLHFPAIPSSINKISIVEYKDKKYSKHAWIWEDLLIK